MLRNILNMPMSEFLARKHASPLTRNEAYEEAARRFGFGTSRFWDFVASWHGVMRKSRKGNKYICREKYRNQYGRGRRSRQHAV